MFNWEKEFVDYDLEDAVKRCVKAYGIEGCEDLAYKVLDKMPTFKDKFLETLYNLYKFGGNKK
jgi:hypothetical protein